MTNNKNMSQEEKIIKLIHDYEIWIKDMETEIRFPSFIYEGKMTGDNGKTCGPTMKEHEKLLKARCEAYKNGLKHLKRLLK